MQKKISLILAVIVFLAGALRLPALAAANDAPRGAVCFCADGATLSGSGLELDEDGATVCVTEGGSYEITGVSENARIIVKADERLPVTLILAGAELKNEQDEIIYFKTAGSGVIELADGTENRLVCGAETEDTDDADEDDDQTPKGAVRAKCPLTVTGSGRLDIECPVNHGIFAANDLEIESGAITITAANDAIHGKADILISGGTFDLRAAHDGIQASEQLTVTDGVFSILTGVGAEAADMKTGDSNMMGGRPGGAFPGAASGEAQSDDTGSKKGLKAGEAIEIAGGGFDIDAEDDAIHCDGDIVIAGGKLRILSGDDGVHADDSLTVTGGVMDIGLSFEGLEAPDLLIEDGWISIVAVDDGMNANGGSGMLGPFASGETSDADTPVLRINGGVITVDAGGDGLDSNGNLYINGGTVYVSGPSTNWDSPLDSDGALVVTGGTLIAAGYSGMAEYPETTADSQPVIFYVSGSYAPDGETVTLRDADGNVLLDYAFAHSFNTVILSDPALTVGQTYYLSIGEETTEIPMTDTLYSNYMRGGFGGFGGRR